MPQFTTLIVGAHFRPPAKQVLAHLAQGAPLQLVLDNENAYDAAAVKVMFDPKHIPETEWSSLDEELLETGNTIEQVLSAGPIQLGFIPAQEGKPLAKARLAEPELLGNLQVRELMDGGEAGADQAEFEATLGFAPDGSIRIHLNTPGE